MMSTRAPVPWGHSLIPCRVGEANNTEIAYTTTNSSWLNRVEAKFTALRYFRPG
jgi:hypothetical protein